jgi:phage antirepressor YoqD-like protein
LVLRWEKLEIEKIQADPPHEDAIVAQAFVIINKRNQILIEENQKQRNVIGKTQRSLDVASARLDAAAPKIDFTNRVRESDGLFPFNKAAKILQLPFGRNILFEKLRDDDVLMKNNEPYQRYIDQGYFVHKLMGTIHGISSKTGLPFIKDNYQTFVTGKGMYWLSQKYDGRNSQYKPGQLVKTNLFD